MVPFLAPLLGSMAASLLPATVGTGIAGALGLSGAGAGLIAAAAPKALGAGLGTLLAGGDLGDAALNAVGFGAGSTALSSMMGGAPGAATSAAGTTNAGDAIRALTQTAVGQPQAAPARMMEAPDARNIRAGMGQSRPPIMPGQPPSDQGSFSAPTMAAVNQMASTTVPAGGGSIMPASLGLGSLPGPNGMAMANQNLMMGLPNGAGDFLRDQGMRGFA